MEFEDSQAMTAAFQLPDDSLVYDVQVSAGGDTDRVQVRRLWGTGPRPQEVAGEGWKLRVYRPPGPAASSAAIMLVPGTTGPGTLSGVAALLASHGYVAPVLIYLGEPGMAASLRQLPVEIFHGALRKLGALAGVDAGRLAIYAVSVGVIGVAYAFSVPEAPPVRSLVLVAGSSVVWQALAEGRPPKESAISYAGTMLPYVPIKAETLLGQVIRNAIAGKLSRRPRSRPLTLLPAYASGFADRAAVAAAAIPVEHIDCPILTISGGEDAMWPATQMARELHQRRREHGRASDDLMLDFPEAGHFFRPPATPTTINHNDSLVVGGVAAGWARAQREAWTGTLAFLAATLDSA